MNIKSFKFYLLVSLLVFALSGCGSSDSQVAESVEVERQWVDVRDAHGTISVPVNPVNVVALDSRMFETLELWGIELAAVPKGVMPADSGYVLDETVGDIGNHREPDLELLASVNPELVIVGQRFTPYYEDIKEIVPDAIVIDLTLDVSEESSTPGENLIAGLKNSTEVLGLIFDKEEESKALIETFDESIEALKASYDGEETVMSIIVSGGDVNFSAPSTGRVWGPLYDVFAWRASLDIDNASSDHQGDDISIEAIAQTNPDWLLVLDRDAAVASATDAVLAEDVIQGSPALENTKAVMNGQVVYAPADTYTNESIHTYIELFDTLSSAFSE